MDRQQADRVRTLFLCDSLELPRADCFLLADEADESLNVGPTQLFVGAGEPRELAHVRVTTAPVPLGERGQVVVVLGDDRFEQPLERERRRHPGQPLEALAEGAEKLLVMLRELGRQALLEGLEERALGAALRRSTSASFETPTSGEASTVTSASSS